MRRASLVFVAAVFGLLAAVLAGLWIDPYADLAGSRWTLAEMDGKPVTARGDYSLHFEGGAAIEGWGGCNHYSGYYRRLYWLPFGPITAQATTWTKKNCTDGTLALDQALGEALRRTRRFAVVDGDLVAYGEGGAVVMRFRRASTTR
jgi:heat shock protein HslJ